jgi:hypothetical protein
MSRVGDTRPVSSDLLTSTRTRRRILLPAALVVVSAGLSWGGLQSSLDHAADGCYSTPPGYLEQQVVDVHRTWWSVDCVIDPRNGDDHYTVHRPWQSVRAIEEISGP